MKISVKLFGAFRKHGDGSSICLEIPHESTVRELKSLLASELKALCPGFEERDFIDQLMRESAIADDSCILEESSVLQEGSAIAILPPICGG